MTKEELMRYANDPFWVRLRWIFFILFWALWLAMLVGAIFIIVGAPKCEAPKALPWYKQGPLVKLTDYAVTEDQLNELSAVGTKAVIYRLPPRDTYRVHEQEVSDEIKDLVNRLSNSSIHLILDVTPNYVSPEDELYKLAINNETYRSAFVFAEGEAPPNNWLSKVNGSAWHQYEAKHYVLSQFGTDRYDLQLNNTLAKEKFKTVLEQLVKLGVKGIRLENFEHYIINTDLKKDEIALGTTGTSHTEYTYWSHTQTTYQPGLSELISEFEAVVKNATSGDGFVSVTDRIVKPEEFKSKEGKLSIELPISGTFPRTLASAYTPQTVDQLFNELTQIVTTFGNSSWVQWQYDDAELAKGKLILKSF